jgi:hypothetical protein
MDGADADAVDDDGVHLGLSDTEVVALRSIALRLTSVVAGIGFDPVVAVVSDCYSRTAGARVQNFRFVLAESAAYSQVQRMRDLTRLDRTGVLNR